MDNVNIIGKSKEILDVLNIAKTVASSDAAVLIYGESGTGKELLARFIFNNSKRKDKNFISINCAAIPENLLENELFGHKKGAFTDAIDDYIGKFGYADQGVIFLDEIGELSLPLQSKLLRVLQFKEYEQIGSNETLKTDVRIIAATNKNLHDMIKQGKFREDLFYRLNVIPITMPSLKERKGDIKILAEHFVNLYNQKYGKKIEGLSNEAIIILENHSWRGNIRELQNVIERAVIFCENNILSTEYLYLANNEVDNSHANIKKLQDAVNEFKKDYIIKALELNNWNQTKTAKVLDIQRTYLARLIKELNIDKY
jgi:transcriptional regulator with PAS, ATPase and Fis domain